MPTLGNKNRVIFKRDTLKPKPPLEKVIQAQILDFLKAHGVFCWRSNNAPVFDPKRGAFRAAGKYAPSGLPDVSGLLGDGRAFFIEVKRKGGKVSDEQQAFIDKVNSLGGLAFVAYSVDEVKVIFGKG